MQRAFERKRSPTPPTPLDAEPLFRVAALLEHPCAQKTIPIDHCSQYPHPSSSSSFSSTQAELSRRARPSPTLSPHKTMNAALHQRASAACSCSTSAGPSITPLLRARRGAAPPRRPLCEWAVFPLVEIENAFRRAVSSNRWRAFAQLQCRHASSRSSAAGRMEPCQLLMGTASLPPAIEAHHLSLPLFSSRHPPGNPQHNGRPRRRAV